ncbi:MAG: hypothetical protein KIT11_04800 [Fimbriimonadaceae bacterium]|nr:hypothetical protein [Fimbriimonadaceae bacterium]QYK56787.1 MAG: hypothetical protein KF733_04720 [Fimbriimonadaceae bacterium]
MSRAIGIASLLCVAMLAGAQNYKKIERFDQKRTAPASVVDTLTFRPQVLKQIKQPPFPPMNPDSRRVLKPGTPNNLVPGTALSDSRARGLKSFPGMDQLGWYPPDPQIAVSSTHVVQVVNSSIAFFNRSGALEFQQTFDAFFAGLGASNYLFDPKVFYDSSSKRFFVIVLDVDFGAVESHYLIACSDDENPNGRWNRYRIDDLLEVDNNKFWLDYPGFGFNKDAIAVSGNMFAFDEGETFVQAQLLNKNELINGGPVTVSRWVDNETFTIQWARSVDTTDPRIYGASIDFTSSTQIRAYAFRGIGSDTPELVYTFLNVPNYRFVGGAPSAGGRRQDTLSGRIVDAGYNNGSLVAAHTTTLSATKNEAAVSWYEFRMAGWPDSGQRPSVRQSGVIGFGNGVHAYQPGIGINKFGEIGMIFTRSSASVSADVLVTGRRASDPLGTMAAPIQVATSSGLQQNGSRWGDYYSVSIDPVDGKTFWGNAQVNNPRGWGTVIHRWNLAPAGGINNADFARPDNVRIFEGTLASGTLASLREGDGNTYQVDSFQRPDRSQYVRVELSYDSPYSAAEAKDINVYLRAFNVPGKNPTGTVFLWNYATKKWDFIKSFTTTGTSADYKIQLVGTAKNYISSKRMKVQYRVHDPVRRNGASPTPFRMRADTVQVEVTR